MGRRHNMGAKQGRKLRKRVLDRDGHKCLECGATEDLTMDHIIPRSKGGPNAASNLQTLCDPCNHKKADTG